MKEEKFPHTKKPPHWWRRGWWWVGGELWRHRGEPSNRGAEGKVERFPHKDQCRPALTSLRGLSAHPPGWWGLRAEARALEVRSQGED